MKIGIVGLPNVGKSTLFNALTDSYTAEAQNFPFCTIEPNVGIVDVKDPRIDNLSVLSSTQKKIYATIKFVDIAGIVKGASQGEGLGNKFLAHIREVDAIVQVLRHFKDSDVSHVEGNVDPLRDCEIINAELIISDLEQVDNKLPTLEKALKAKNPESLKMVPLLQKIREALLAGKLIFDIWDEFSDEEQKLLKAYNFLTAKPFIYAINIAVDELPNYKKIEKEYFDILQKPTVCVCAKMEHDMIGLSNEEKKMFTMEVMGNSKEEAPTLDHLIKTAFDEVGLMYYFTTGEKETRARTIKKNSTAPQAASAIHTDFEKGFIKAEVVSYKDFAEAGSYTKAKENGRLRLEGKDYIVQDGDIIVFKFNV